MSSALEEPSEGGAAIQENILLQEFFLRRQIAENTCRTLNRFSGLLLIIAQHTIPNQ